MAGAFVLPLSTEACPRVLFGLNDHSADVVDLQVNEFCVGCCCLTFCTNPPLSAFRAFRLT